MTQRDNLAARAGRWSAAHWKTATLAWLVFVVAAIAIGHTVGTHMLTDAEQSTGETAQAESLLAHAHFNTPAQENVNSQSNSPVKGEPRWEES